eukprot:1323905-Prymnesium_polylepis.1
MGVLHADVGGYGATAVAAAEKADTDPTGVGSLSVSGLRGAADASRDELLEYIRRRYGNHAE